MPRVLGLTVPLLLLLAACTPPPEEYAERRTQMARAEDSLAECRLLALNQDFTENFEQCQAFLEQDDHCIVFPEKKEGCIQFLRAPNYVVRKTECQTLMSQERSCAQLVDTKIPSWFYDAAKWVGLDWKKKTWIEWVIAFRPKIHLGVIWSGYGGESFRQGLDLALEEINNRDGGVLGRELELHFRITNGDLDASRKYAEEMRDDPKIRGVVGRQFSSNTIPVVYVYDNSDIIYLAISATNNSVIRYGMRFIFRQIPSNDSFSRALVNLCVQQDYKNIALLYSRDAYSEELAYGFRDYAVKSNLKITFEKSFFGTQGNFADIAANMKELELDAIFLATLSATAVNVIRDLRAMNINVPLLGSDALDSDAFARSVGEKGNGLVVPTIYNPFSRHPENARFVKSFKNRYGYTPDTWAAQGYDALKLLGYAMREEAKSTIPANVATALRYMPPQTGATGVYAYEQSGELMEKPIYFKELQHEEFILFKDTKLEEEQSKRIEIVDDRIILHPEKPSESTEAMSVF